MSVFDVFAEFVSPYTFMELENTARGYKVKSQHNAEGIFKLVDGKTNATNMEQVTSDARLKVKTEETFASTNMVGNGIKIVSSQGEQTYRIDGQSTAQDGDFYNLNLTREDFQWQSQSPLT